MLKFDINLKDPASIYAFHLINLHHKIVWFLILVLAVVYWSFYKIIRDYSWNSYNRQSGIFRISYITPVFFYAEVVFHFFTWWVLKFIWTTTIYFFSKIFEFLIYISSSYSNLNKGSTFDVISEIIYTLHLFLLDYYLTVGFNVITSKESLPFRYILAIKYNTIYSDSLELWQSIVEIIRYKYFHYLTYGSLASPAYFNSSLIFSYNNDNNSCVSESSSDLLMNLPFNERKSLEYIWTFFPSVVIYLILVPSLYLLYSLDDDLEPRFIMKVIGHQWFWSYEFDLNSFNTSYEIDSNLISESDLIKGSKRLLEVDNKLYLPVNVPFKVLITSTDVLHSWSVPELGIKVDAVPGRLNETLVCITRPGIFYGQCSELCGVGHGFMPIVIQAVSFNCWADSLNSIKI